MSEMCCYISGLGRFRPLVHGDGATVRRPRSTTGDGALWSTRESGATALELVVELDSAPVLEGVLELGRPEAAYSAQCPRRAAGGHRGRHHVARRRVQRFSAAGVPAPKEFEAAGYQRPSIATDGECVGVSGSRTARWSRAPSHHPPVGPRRHPGDRPGRCTYSWFNVLGDRRALRLLLAGTPALGGAPRACCGSARAIAALRRPPPPGRRR